MISDLRERLELIVLREERQNVVDIKGAVGFEEGLDDLQLGGCSIDVDHSGCVGSRPVELWWMLL